MLQIRLWLGMSRKTPLLYDIDLSEIGTYELHKGSVAGLPYELFTSSRNRVMVSVRLLQSTNIHFVALGAHSRRNKLLAKRTNNAVLRPVELEGNYNQYFHIFCDPKNEVELRQVLDPATMAYVADFCGTYDVELLDDVLYVTVSQYVHDGNDTTTLMQDVENIVTKHSRLFMRL